jgi:purine-binding chemotaxis protein CheW
MAQPNVNETSQYLSFILEKEVYAVEIGRIREVLEIQTITRIPRTPEFFKGIINLRGHAVPVIDLRIKFGIFATVQTVNTCILILEVKSLEETVVLGALVDAVQEVFDLAQADIEEAPRMGTRVRMDFIQGIGRIDQKFVIILGVDRVFSEEELALVKQAETHKIEPDRVEVVLEK